MATCARNSARKWTKIPSYTKENISQSIERTCQSPRHPYSLSKLVCVTSRLPNCPCWGPQMVVVLHVPFEVTVVRIPRVTEVICAHNVSRCSWSRVQGMGAVDGGVAIGSWIPRCKGPDVLTFTRFTRIRMCHRQTLDVGVFQGILTSILVAVECTCKSVLVSLSSSTYFIVGNPKCWKLDWEATFYSRVRASAHWCTFHLSVGHLTITTVISCTISINFSYLRLSYSITVSAS